MKNEMTIVWKPIDEIIPYDKNPRKDNIKASIYVAKSIEKYGWQAPILIDKNNVIAYGHSRLLGAKHLGLTEVPTLPAKKDGKWLTEAECRAYRIADNRVGEYTKWDNELLAVELEQLQIDFPEVPLVELTMMKEGEISKLIETEIEGENNVPAPKTTDINRGDIFILDGKHRLMCGDAGSETDIKSLMDGKLADMVFTDPPYGVSIGDKNKMLNKFQKSGCYLENIENDTMTPENLNNVLLSAFINCREYMADHASIYVTSPQGGGLGLMMMNMLKDAGLEARHILNWIKSAPTFSMGRLDYDYQHEPILYTWKKNHVFYGNGAHKTSCWQIAKPRKCDVHPTMKPVELVENAILNSTERGMLTLDIFMGSGTTLIASEKHERISYGIEIDPLFCQVILDRYKEFTKTDDIVKANEPKRIIKKETAK